ncbi:MAG: sulfite exporter TauE/SafE family protein [Cellvibrionaceae bacterium]|nr:sulfite exporter TauE/SafE family protein [Cellvibrionaceae bacterium]
MTPAIELLSILPIIITLMMAGVIAGTLAGLLGVGGGIVIVPVLYFLFQLLGTPPSHSMVIATGTSLAIIVPTSISSVWAHHHKGNVDWYLIRRWCLFIMAGVLAGACLVTVVDGRYFVLVFAVIALCVAFNFLWQRPGRALFSRLPVLPLQGFLAVCIGFLSAMAGIGGGSLGVATLTTFNYTAYRAIGTSAVFGLLISLPGALLLLVLGQTPDNAPLLTLGYVNLLALMIIAPLSVLFAPVGVLLGARLNSRLLKRLFGILLMATAIKMLLQLILEYLFVV